MNLIEIRRKKGMKQEEIARMVGLSRAGYSNIETGRRRPSVDMAKRIAAALGFEWTRFYETADQPFSTDDAASRVEDAIRRMVV